jgi:uncharacterized protein involved in outer membrane biogenesis
MSRARRILGGMAVVVAVGVVALVAVAWSRLPSQEEAAERIAQIFHERTGVKVDIADVHWSLWPTPTLVIENAVTRQSSPIVARSIRLQASWRSLLRRQPQVQDVALDGLVVPQLSLAEFRLAPAQDQAPREPWARDGLGGVQLRFHDLTWIDRRAIELAYEGRIDFDDDGLPREARLARADAPVQVRIEREGQNRQWRVLIDVPGGTWNGDAELRDAANGRLRLSARLQPKNVDVEALAGAFKRRAVVAGRANGSTTVTAEGDTPIELVRSLRTTTQFAMRPAQLLRLDLAKAVRSAGASEGGKTLLDEFTGVLETRNTGKGVLFRYTDLHARSGILSASGSISLLRRKLDGEAAIDLVDGVVGIPLKISGTVEDPELSMTGGALAGAAVGTAVLPGVGTALGARVGQQVERLLGGPAPAKSPGQSPSPPAKPQR